MSRQQVSGEQLFDRKLDPSTQALTLADVRRPGAPLVYVNSGFEKMTGYTRMDAVGKNCRFLQGPETSAEAVTEMRSAIVANRPLIIDVLNYRKDGSAFWNRLSLTPVKGLDGQATHYIGIQSDISRMRVLHDRLHEIALDLARANILALD